MPECCACGRPAARFRAVSRAIFGTIIAVAVGAPAIADTSARRADELTRLVLQDCGSCHGMTLKGGLGPDIRAGTLAGWSRDALIAVILDGVPETPMPPWRPLITDDDAAWIADFLLSGGRP